MYVEVREGWRYKPGERSRIQARFARLQQEVGGGVPTLKPTATPGLIAHLIATDPHDTDTGIEVWVWESSVAAAAYEDNLSPEARRQRGAIMDSSTATTRHLNGLYFACSH